jgi:CRISPR-associated protein Csx10
MKAFRLLVRTRAPLVIASRQAAQGGATQSQDFIPGSTLRGALAAALLQGGEPDDSALFQGLFASGQVRYGNLYPTVAKAVTPSWPLPTTAWSCKIQSGFWTDPTVEFASEAPHGTLDTLAAQLDGSAWEQHDRCSQSGCGSPREPLDGYYALDENGAYLHPQHSRRLITRTAMDGRWGTARSGFLYTVEAVEEDQLFVGFVKAGDGVAQQVQDTLGRVQTADSLRVGLGRSRGLGHVTLQEIEPERGHLGFEQPCAERWRSASLERRLRKVEADDRFAFAITLYADAILLDDYGRYQNALNDAALKRVLRYAGQPPEGIIGWPGSLHYEWGATAIHPVVNWRFAPGWGKRTAEELAVARGSVFVFSALHSEEAAVMALAARLEEDGIGRRRDEGFGQVVVGHPWHGEGVR